MAKKLGNDILGFVIPFGRKLQERLDEFQPPRSQTWLAEEAGISTSFLSRLIRGDRNPTPAVIESLAPVLGIEPMHLVSGTDAEGRYLQSGELVKKEIYEAAARQLAANQVLIADLQERVKDLPLAHAQLGQTLRDLDLLRRDADDLRSDNKQLRQDLQKYRSALEQAVAEYSALQGQLKTLADELAGTKKSSRASAILAAVGAFTGAVTMTHFLNKAATSSNVSDAAAPKKKPRKTKANG